MIQADRNEYHLFITSVINPVNPNNWLDLSNIYHSRFSVFHNIQEIHIQFDAELKQENHTLKFSIIFAFNFNDGDIDYNMTVSPLNEITRVFLDISNRSQVLNLVKVPIPPAIEEDIFVKFLG